MHCINRFYYLRGFTLDMRWGIPVLSVIQNSTVVSDGDIYRDV